MCTIGVHFSETISLIEKQVWSDLQLKVKDIATSLGKVAGAKSGLTSSTSISMNNRSVKIYLAQGQPKL